jgi:DNA processing protein
LFQDPVINKKFFKRIKKGTKKLVSFLFRNTLDNNKKILLHLSLIENIGPTLVLKFLKTLFDQFLQNQKNAALQKIEFDLNNIYDFSKNDFIQKFGFTQRQAEILSVGLQDKSVLEKELQCIEKYNIDFLSFIDEDYPSDLKEIYAPPIVIYCKGEKLKNYGKKIAIVGSRKSTAYAEKVLNNIVPDLIKNNFTVVSGGAYGVDTIAHKAAVKEGGKTIVVLGAGLLQPVNLLNRDFLKEVANGLGTLVSPFPLMREADRGTFPARNRVISGLSSGCLVVQAAQKSGALITAQHSLDEGRHVFAIPGNIFDSVSQGCNNLIKLGAKPVTCAQDILDEFGITEKKNEDKILKSEVEEIKVSKKALTQNDKILNVLDREMSLDELSLKLCMDLDDLQEKLFDLQLDGKVEQSLSGYWELI